ncbi:hypothetical protein EAS64_21530 [Trebonia kvetii]|uniref:Uncharacterized protein n=1 Tax=Trebonia kvetii TaxID=2480626 RepID=A0A6P2BVV7_9ACTN|nr:hypothetical protein [Trebonia kvetii]TVZ03040.1 hypothetical protein EAS64_21530 [Trebonia kvetii]
MFNRESVIGFLLRRPGALNSQIARWAVLALTTTGAGFLVWSGVIHLMLWSDGYKDISVIGPLFLLQGIASIVIAVAVVAFRWLALLVIGAVTGVATAVGLLLSVNVGLFGFTESLASPYAELSLAVEFTAAFVLLVAACLLAFAQPAAQVVGRRSPVPTRT